jgi:pimeloyl-ACP methyl ester carboxylesterase
VALALQVPLVAPHECGLGPLVGHSYGGTLITHAGTDDRVRGLVFIAALGPDENETSQGPQDNYSKTPVFGHIEVAEDRIWLLESGVQFFASDLSEEEQKVVWATAMPCPRPLPAEGRGNCLEDEVELGDRGQE